MKSYKRSLSLRISLLSLSLIGVGYTLAYSKLWICGVLALIALSCAYNLFRFIAKNIRDMNVFINSIHFSETNIAFPERAKKEPLSDLYARMNSALKIFNERIRKKEENVHFYDLLLNRIDFALIVTDDGGNIVWINKAALDMLGRPKPKSLNEMLEKPNRLISVITQIGHGETRMLKSENREKEYNLVVTRTDTTMRENNVRIFCVKNVQTVVEKTELESYQKMIHILTHEIMNSITPIISLSETFSETDQANDPETMLRAIQIIHRRSKGLVKFVSNYRKLIHIPPLEKERINPMEMIMEVASLLKAQQIDFSYLATHKDIYVEVDRSQMEQVLINLIKNAWEACEDTHPPKVELMVTQDERHQVFMTIADNGMGILPEVADKIFLPFFTTKREGSGIGLSLSRQIVNAHGGTLTCDSKPGKGTIFTIKLRTA